MPATNNFDSYTITEKIRNRMTYTALPFLLLLLAYHGLILKVFSDFFSFNSSYALIILSIGCYVIWKRKDRLSAIIPKPNVVAGLGLIVTGCLLLIIGRFTCTLFVEALSLVIMLFGIICSLWGYRYCEVLLSLSFIVFMLPCFNELYSGLSIYLQITGAYIASSILNLVGIPNLLSGQYIQLPYAGLDVARECNGVNHILALVALAVIVSSSDYEKWPGKIILILLALSIGIFTNGLRVAAIGIRAAYSKGAVVHGADDVLYVPVIFVFGTALLLMANGLLKKYLNGEKRPGKTLYGGPKVQQNSKRPPGLSKMAGSAIILLTVLLIFLVSPKPVLLSKPLALFPSAVGDWVGRDLESTDSAMAMLPADVVLHRSYRHVPSGRKITLSILYMGIQSQDRKLAGYQADWLFDHAKAVPISPGRTGIPASINISRSARGNFYFWYDMNGKVLTSRAEVKAGTLLDTLLTFKNNGALVLVSAEDDVGSGTSPERTFVEEVIRLVRVYVTAPDSGPGRLPVNAS